MKPLKMNNTKDEQKMNKKIAPTQEEVAWEGAGGLGVF
jgi:hypothetical protein